MFASAAAARWATIGVLCHDFSLLCRTIRLLHLQLQTLCPAPLQSCLVREETFSPFLHPRQNTAPLAVRDLCRRRRRGITALARLSCSLLPNTHHTPLLELLAQPFLLQPADKTEQNRQTDRHKDTTTPIYPSRPRHLPSTPLTLPPNASLSTTRRRRLILVATWSVGQQRCVTGLAMSLDQHTYAYGFPFARFPSPTCTLSLSPSQALGPRKTCATVGAGATSFTITTTRRRPWFLCLA